MNKLSFEKYDKGMGANFWIQFCSLALCGQICWNIENQWFNTYLYSFGQTDSSYVTWMVIVSATLTTISTFIFGTLCDRKAQRRKFLGWGYILWGISTIVVGFCQYIVNDSLGDIAKLMVVAGVLVVITDGVMSFIGSIAYDSSFNVWVNDHTTEHNKGLVGTIYGIMPVVGTILGSVIGGMLIGDDKNYMRLFLVMGLFVSVCGVVSLFVTKEKANLKPNKDGTFWQHLCNPFRFKELFKKMPNYKEMLLAGAVICCYNVGFNLFFAHLGNWAIFNEHLGFDEDMFGYIEGIALVLGVALAFPISKLINKDHMPLVVSIGLVTSVIGLFWIYLRQDSWQCDPNNIFALANLELIVTIFFIGTGLILINMACMIWVRGLFPQKDRGQFEGMRSVFFVWAPMVLGSTIGNIILKKYSAGGINPETLAEINIPDKELFLVGAIIILITFIPLFFAWKSYDKRIKAKKAALASGVIDATLFDAIPLDENNDEVNDENVACDKESTENKSNKDEDSKE